MKKTNTDERGKIIRRLLTYTRPYRIQLTASLILALLQVAATLFIPVVIGRAIDNIIAENMVDFDAVAKDVGLIAALVLCGTIFQLLLSFCTNKVAHCTVCDLRKSVMEKLGTLPLSYIDSNSHGDIMSRVVTDISLISDGLLHGFTQLFTGIATIIGTIIMMLIVNFRIGLVVVLLTPLSMFAAAFIAKLCYGMFKEQSAARGELSGVIEEYVSNRRTVRSFSYEDRAQEKFDRINQRLLRCGVKAQFYSALTNPTTRFVNGIVYASVTVFGALAVVGGAGLTVGSLSCFLSYATQYTKPFNEITGVIAELQNAVSSAKRVFSLLDEESEDDGTEDIPESCEKTVSIENVSFSYTPSQHLIENFSLDVPAGSRIAIVGPTGCGKTTLINLLMRFYDVTSGRIEVGGYPIKEVTRSSLRSMYGMVLQDTWLFNGTVRDNIAYGRTDATDEEIIAAAKQAHAHGFIKRLRNGYDTVLSADGGSLSQGQKQLLCIARIMLTTPPMLILDEATSSIDTRTEIRIQDAFAHIMEGRTSFIVAHRLSTIRSADVILVMRDGRIVEQGKHGELIKKNGFYAQMYNSAGSVTEDI